LGGGLPPRDYELLFVGDDQGAGGESAIREGGVFKINRLYAIKKGGRKKSN